MGIFSNAKMELKSVNVTVKKYDPSQEVMYGLGFGDRWHFYYAPNFEEFRGYIAFRSFFRLSVRSNTLYREMILKVYVWNKGGR